VCVTATPTPPEPFIKEPFALLKGRAEGLIDSSRSERRRRLDLGRSHRVALGHARVRYAQKLVAGHSVMWHCNDLPLSHHGQDERSAVGDRCFQCR
jgi:hypothetical protein